MSKIKELFHSMNLDLLRSGAINNEEFTQNEEDIDDDCEDELLKTMYLRAWNN